MTVRQGVISKTVPEPDAPPSVVTPYSLPPTSVPAHGVSPPAPPGKSSTSVMSHSCPVWDSLNTTPHPKSNAQPGTPPSATPYRFPMESRIRFRGPEPKSQPRKEEIWVLLQLPPPALGSNPFPIDPPHCMLVNPPMLVAPYRLPVESITTPVGSAPSVPIPTKL